MITLLHWILNRRYRDRQNGCIMWALLPVFDWAAGHKCTARSLIYAVQKWDEMRKP